MRLKLIACEVLYREICAAVAGSTNRVDVEFLPKGLHDLGQAGMSGRLQEMLAAVDASLYEAVLFGYGLCSNGLVGLSAAEIPLVIPRAHDCITLFFGSKERYMEYFQNRPGTYFKTSGWIERGDNAARLDPQSIPSRLGMVQTYEELVAKYGEDNARFLHEQLNKTTRNYGQMAYIEMGVEPDDRFERAARESAEVQGWKFEKIPGDMALIRQLVDGPWDEDRFLVVEPGSSVAASFDEQIITAGKASE